MEDIVHPINVHVFLDDFVFGLTTNSWQEVHSHGEITLASESAKVDHNTEGVPLEELEVIFNKDARKHLLLGHLHHLVLGSLLKNTSVLLFVLASVGSLHALSLHKLRFSKLFILGLVICKLLVFPLFSDLNLGLVESFANQNLEDGGSFSLKIKKRSCVKLILLVNSVKFGNENGIGRLINIEIRFDLKLIHLA